MNILSKKTHNIKLGTKLVLYNRVFPYPPFSDSKLISSSIGVTTKTDQESSLFKTKAAE